MPVTYPTGLILWVIPKDTIIPGMFVVEQTSCMHTDRRCGPNVQSGDK